MVIKKAHFLSLLLLATLLLAVRLIFFLQDFTSKQMESILMWLIYGISILAIIAFLSLYKDHLKTFHKKHQDKLIFLSVLLFLEIGLIVANDLVFSKTHFFSILFSICLLIFISLILPKKGSRIFDITFIILMGIYTLGQDFYYGIFNDMFSFKEAVTIREGVESSESMFKIEFFHVLIILVVSISLYFYIKNKQTSHYVLTRQSFKKALLVIGLPFFLIQLNAIYPVKAARLHTSDHYLYTSMFSKRDFVTKFGSTNLLIRDMIAVMTPNFSTKKDVSYIEKYFENYPKEHTPNLYTGIFEGKNLILVIGETYDELALDPNLTPHLYKLKSEGIDFSNHFTPVFPRTTCDTEFIINTSIVPSIEDGPTCYTYNKNSYETSLAQLFNRQGYTTAAFHSNYKEFYTRHLLYEGFRYDQFYGQHELGMSDVDIRYDSVFYDFAKDYVTPDEPFFSMMLTLSGHSPYTTANLAVKEHIHQVDAYYDDTYPQTIKNYIATQIELDLFIANLFDDLEQKNLMDDTVIMLTGDHYPYTLNQDDYEAAKSIEEHYEKHRGNLYIWANDIEPQKIELLSSSFDILPMINNMFNLDGNYSHYVGNDIFSSSGNLVLFKDYSIYDGQDYIQLSGSYQGLFVSQIEQAQRYYEVSKKLLRTNYFKE
ncbi:MAG: LTA synthase family protein [Acholeplasmataceae bacterium]|jgi:phosphoglycerol transferase MdoB-like AlkP superfamily enzyme|nr:LTA synthase family protein [Acholeplasmataceae bacterium]